MIKKVFRTVKTVLVWLMVTLAVSMMVFTVISVTTFNRNDRNLFGYKIYIVQTDSMAKTDFDAGALIFVKEVDPATLREGDIITFISQGAESFGQTVTHKIRKLTADAENNPGFITYGTTTDVDDETVVTYPYILGKYERHVPHLGTFFQFLKTTPGYVVCIFIPFMMIILYEGIKCFRLFRRYKTEQMDQMQAENAKILERLRMLEAQLAQQQAAEQASAEADRWPADAV